MPRPPARDDRGLELMLTALAREVAFPETPDLARAVRARIAAGPRESVRVRPRRLWLALGAAVLVVVATLGLALSPSARDAVADFLGLGGIRIGYGPSPRPASSAGAKLALGAPSTLAGAQDEVDFDVLVPAAAGFESPDAVFVSQVPPGGRVSLVYRPRADLPETESTGTGMIVTEFEATIGPDLGKKILSEQAGLRPTTVGGALAYWIPGPHAFYLYRDKTGEIREDTIRNAGNTLLWERDGVTLRIESELGLAPARRIALSMS